MKNHCCRTLLFVLMIAAGCAAQSGGVSLGELARKNRTKQKPVMVFDDDTMRRSAVTDQDTGSGSASSGSSAAAAASQADAPTRDKKPDKKDEAKSSTSSPGDDNVSKLQKRLNSLKQEQSAWSKSAKDYEEKLANETDEFRRQTYEEALKNDKSNVQVYQQRIDQTEADLAKAQQAATKPDNSAQGPMRP